MSFAGPKSNLTPASPPPARKTAPTVAGIVSSEQPAPSAFTDPLYVVFDRYTSTGGITFSSWPRSHGDSILPVAGDSVVVHWDSQGDPHVIGWGI